MSTQTNKTKLRIREIAQIGMLAAVAVVLMLFEIPLPFAPSFYKLDISEVPVLVGCFAMGPLAGAMIELVKVLLNLLIDSSVTAGVGETANFLIGCSFCVPAGLIYKKIRTKKGAMAGLVTGTLSMTLIGCCMNAYILLPAYAKAFHMPIEELVGLGTAVNENITSLFTFVFFAVVPFNLLKGVLVSIIVLLIYKKISPVLKMNL